MRPAPPPLHRRALRFFGSLAFGASTCASAAPAEVIDLAEIQPVHCAGPFKYVAASKSCEADAEKLDKMKFEEQCDGTGLSWDAATKKCSALAGKAPKPSCGDSLPDLTVKDGKCVVQRGTPRSAAGNFVGDCFTIVATPLPNEFGFDPKDKLVVLSQRDDGDDRVLRVAQARLAKIGPVPMPYFCETVGPELKSLRASELNAAGAKRVGWTYGVLALPFKYYRRDRTFGSGVSLGPYVGRRSGAAGSAITFAVAATIGSVKGEIKDANGNVTGTPDLMAFSYALGWMYDISKSAGIKPFKLGLFFGQDRVSKDKAVSYKQNGQTWVAFQIGFDFTDN